MLSSSCSSPNCERQFSFFWDTSTALRAVLPYVYPTVLRRVQQAPKTNCRRGRMSKIKQRPGGSQRESQQQACIAAARSRSTRGFLVHQVACTAQTQTESWAPPNFWQQDASACRWVYVYSCTFALWLHLLPAFSSSSRISRSLLCFSPCALTHGRQDWRTRGWNREYSAALDVGRGEAPVHVHGDDIDRHQALH